MRLLSLSEASIQKRTSTAKFARSPCTDPPGLSWHSTHDEDEARTETAAMADLQSMSSRICPARHLVFLLDDSFQSLQENPTAK